MFKFLILDGMIVHLHVRSTLILRFAKIHAVKTLSTIQKKSIVLTNANPNVRGKFVNIMITGQIFGANIVDVFLTIV